jgi:glutathione S-transferase
MITVHHLNNSRSQRILWLLEELGLDYEIVSYQRDPMTRRAPPALRAIHPLGKSPVIQDGPLTLAESGAIIEYLIDTYGKGALAPARGTAEHTRYRYWMHFAEGTAMTQLLLRLFLGFAGESAAPIRAMVDAEIVRLLAYLESEIADRPFFVGENLTGADINMSFPLEGAAARAGLDAASYPKLLAHLHKLQARPAYRRAVDRGGPYELTR